MIIGLSFCCPSYIFGLFKNFIQPVSFLYEPYISYPNDFDQRIACNKTVLVIKSCAIRTQKGFMFKIAFEMFDVL